jgi:hypothetical protein
LSEWARHELDTRNAPESVVRSVSRVYDHPIDNPLFGLMPLYSCPGSSLKSSSHVEVSQNFAIGAVRHRFMRAPTSMVAIAPPRFYLVRMLTLPAPLLAVISTLLAAPSKSGDWYVFLSVLWNDGSTITLPSPLLA